MLSSVSLVPMFTIARLPRAGPDFKVSHESYREGKGHYRTVVLSVTAVRFTFFVSRYMVFGEQGVGEPDIVFESIHCDRLSKP